MVTTKAFDRSSFWAASTFAFAFALVFPATAQEPPAGSTNESAEAPPADEGTESTDAAKGNADEATDDAGATANADETTDTTDSTSSRDDDSKEGEPSPATDATLDAPVPASGATDATAADAAADVATDPPAASDEDAAEPPAEQAAAAEPTTEAATDAETEGAEEKKDDASEEPPTNKKPKFTDATIIEPAPAPSQGNFQLRYSSLNTVRVNPLGLISINTLGARFRLYDSDNPLIKDNYVGIAVRPTVSGAFARGGVLAEVQPLSVLRLWAAFDALYFFGIFSLFQSFEDPKANYSDSRISELASIGTVNDPRRNYATFGTQATVGVDFKIKLGPVAARSLTRVVRSDFNMRQGDRVFYDQLYDMLSPNNGVMVTNDTDLLGYFDLGFLNVFNGMRVVGGIRSTVTAGLYDPSRYAPDDPDGSTTNLIRRTFAENAIWRAGPLVSLTLFDEPGALFNKPTIFMAAQWHIIHRWRTDADVSRLIPYTFLGFAFSGDFLNL